TVAKMLGMSPEALRYYERKRIVVNLESDNDTGYRQFIRHSITHIMKARFLRSMEFSLTEVNEQNSQGIYQVNDRTIINGSPLESWLDTLDRREQQLRLEIEQKEKILSSVQKYHKQVDSINTLHKKHLIEFNPEMLYVNFSNENDEMLGSIDDIFQTKKCVDLFPVSRYAFMCSRDKLRLENCIIKHGFLIPLQEAKKADICTEETVTLPSTLCLHTVVSMSVNELATTNMLQNAVRYIADHTLTITGDAFGMWIANALDGDRYIKYFEVWIPIGTN
ncbi:MAG: MerR family transcriptional regulator, partial [Bacillota bacterium]|nr:MerR family transcriptional regulator [Bacillota bacterium]